VRRYLDILLDPKALKAALTWPAFAMSSFKMVSALVRQGARPRTVIDVGAHLGQFAFAAASIFGNPNIYCIEPNPEAADSLKRRALPNMHVLNLAAGETIGRTTLRVNSHSDSSSILALGQRHLEAFPFAREVRAVEVEMSTLDAISFDLVPPVLLKLDVQGYESKVLAGAPKLLRRCDYVVIEMSMEPLYEGEVPFAEMLPLMRSYGYRFVREVGALKHPRSGAALQIDGFFRREL